MNKKIAVIGTNGIPAKYGGWETLVEYLTQYLSKSYNITVYCSTSAYEKKLESHNGAKLKYISLKANGVQSIPYDIYTIIHALFYADTLLILGVSGCIVLPIIKFFTKKKIVVNIDGLEWKRAKWGKWTKRFLKLSEKAAVLHADQVLADNKVIQDYIKTEYGKESALIPYGADHCERLDLSDEVLSRFPFLKQKYSFKVCRIEPENNIEMILKAFSKAKQSQLVIIGNWQNSDFGVAMKNQYSVYENIHLLDPIYDQNILNQIRTNCSLYIHGHSAGGTNPSLVEAMYLKLCIVSFNVNFNMATTENAALYFGNVDDLVHILNDFDNGELLTESYGVKMKEIADVNYKWSVVADKYAAVF